VGTNKRERQKANRQLRLEELAKQARRNRSRRYAFIVGGIVVGVIALIGVIQLFTDDSTTTADTTTTAVTTTVPGPTTTAAPLPDFVYGTGDCAPDDGADQKGPFAAAPKLCIDPTKTYTATFITTEGTIEVALDAADLPGTVNNFVNLSRFGYYNDSKIFRADPSLDIIQGGGLTNTDSPGYTIPDEANGFTYQEGDLVMARTGQADSAGAQFFFVGGPNGANLDNQGTYVTFGHVTKGIEVVKAILGLAGADGQTPTRDVTVTSITITES
ncbi:unnamed protein product, partial [Phaeothamnion confervicola]